MMSRFCLTGYEPAGLKLSSSDYLFKETRNEAKAVMKIVEAIRKKTQPYLGSDRHRTDLKERR